METFSSDVLEKQWYVVVILSVIASKYKNGAPSPREFIPFCAFLGSLVSFSNKYYIS